MTTTTPATDPQIIHNARIARKFLDDSDREFAAGDLLQSSAKLWGAVSHALKALCRQRNWRHAKYAHRRDAAQNLAAELGDPTLFRDFQIAQSCHANFYNDWMYAEDVDSARIHIRETVEKILNLIE